MIKVKRTDRFDDSSQRDAWERFCKTRGHVFKPGGQKDKIDGFTMSERTGKIVATELACNSCWATGNVYPETCDVYIPARKLAYFRDILKDCEVEVSYDGSDSNRMRVDEGYLVLFNIDKTRAALVKFSVVLEECSGIYTRELNGELCEVTTIPHNILRYVDIPSETERNKEKDE